MPDFTSSLYLGLFHSTRELPPWRRFTTGVPAALSEPGGATRVGRAAASVMGVERAIVSRSTLHALFDAVGVLENERRPVQFLVDSGTYPVARWALHRAVLRGAPVVDFGHHDVRALRRSLPRRPSPARPVIVADGVCPACGRAPLADYVEVAEQHDGVLLVDDTQAFGILGARPSTADPYGRGGGGTLAWLAVETVAALVVASMAKGFGAPIAVTGGPRSVVERLAVDGDTRVHCSPPTIPDLLAAERALVENAERGDDLRRRLHALVMRLRAGLEDLGTANPVGDFPIQPAGPFPVAAARRVHETLLRRGVRTVLQRPRCSQGATVTFVVTARHRRADVDLAVDALAGALRDIDPTVRRRA
jgi:8-amino-7-oxononanoate synthase